jgi:hypothetical protein
MSSKLKELERRVADLEMIAVIKHAGSLGVGSERGKIIRMLDEGLGVILKPLRVDGRMTLRVEGLPAEPAVPPPVEVTQKPDPRRKLPDKREFVRDLATLLNRHNIESQSNTPDYVLAEYLVGCLEAWSRMSRTIREKHLDSFTGKI